MLLANLLVKLAIMDTHATLASMDIYFIRNNQEINVFRALHVLIVFILILPITPVSNPARQTAILIPIGTHAHGLVQTHLFF